MLLKLSLLCFVSAVFASAQPSGATPETLRAARAVSQLRVQVDAGIASRQKLEAAEQALADANDAEFIHRMLGSGDLTEEQAAQVKEVAQRRLDRVSTNIERQQQLVDAGVLPAQTIITLMEEKQWAQTQYDLAASHAEVVHEIAEMARAEQLRAEQQRSEMEGIASVPEDSTPDQRMERFDGTGVFTPDDFKKIQTAFEKEFTKPLPVSAQGETDVHRAMRFDHRDRVDVAILPDTPEGLWLREYLEASRIPYYAFRGPIPGKSTGAHIHIGPPSPRI